MGLKTSLRKFLIRKGWYYDIKFSWPFKIYENILKPAVGRQRQNELNFYGSFLPSCKLIFDIGANDGHKTEAFLHFSPTVICCEPDPENQKLLEARFRSLSKRVKIEKTAVSNRPGFAELQVHNPASAFNTLSEKWKEILEKQGINKWQEEIKFQQKHTVPTTTLDNMIEKYGRPDFIKIDVEGWEENVLMGLSQPVPILSFETIFPEYQQEFSSCLNMLERLDRSYKFNLAIQETLLISEFLSRKQLETWLESNPQDKSFEVIAKLQP